jgi:hypothetical protein
LPGGLISIKNIITEMSGYVVCNATHLSENEAKAMIPDSARNAPQEYPI